MANCGNKIKQTCGETTYASCVTWEGTPNTQSELFEEECLNVESVIQDQYDQIGEIKEEIDLTALGEACLEYVLDEGKTTVKNVLLKFEEIICEQQSRINTLENRQLCEISIASCNIDTSCLALPCDTTITTLEDLIQAMITKICEIP